MTDDYHLLMSILAKNMTEGANERTVQPTLPPPKKQESGKYIVIITKKKKK